MIQALGGDVLLWVLACADIDLDKQLPDDDAAVAAYLAEPVTLTGTVLDAAGDPLTEATVSVGGRVVETTAEGTFTVSGLMRENTWLNVTAVNHRPASRPVFLMVTHDIDTVDTGPIALQSTSAENARFTFFGDTMFGRRFLDPDDTTPHNAVPTDVDGALIATADPLPGSRAVLSAVRPWLSEADVTVVNLESPVLTDPATPHPDKPYVFFTLPGSLDALAEAGVDYTSLGNNHVYDYLEPGVEDTISLVSAAGLFHSGAGEDLAEAYAPWFIRAGATEHALISASSIDGRTWPIHYNAEADKGGAADLTDTAAFREAVASATLDGTVVIAQLHMGDEYTFAPTDTVRDHVERAREAGASLIVGHHPHTAQGFSYVDGVLAAFSLGNFVFDSDRLETLLGIGLRVDLTAGQLVDAFALPVYIESYQPRATVGPAAAHLWRRIGESSAHDGVWLVPEGGLGWLATDPETVTFAERTVEIPVTVGEDRSAFIDLRNHVEPDESIVSASLDVPLAEATLGRDLLVFGDMEDVDVDADWGEVARWDTDRESVSGCMDARSGVRALCSTRDYSNIEPSVITLRQRVRVWGDAADTPVKDLSLLFHTRARRAGAVRAYVRWVSSEGSEDFGEVTVWARESGTWDWTRTLVPLPMPPDTVGADSPDGPPRALRLFMAQDPQRQRVEGRLAVDDVAVVSWGPETLALSGEDTLTVPNTFQFLRLSAAPGPHVLQVTVSRLERRR